MSEAPDVATADLSDANPTLPVAVPGLRWFGSRRHIAGPITTVSAPEDNTLVRAALEEPGEGRVLVVDGHASARCALVGDQLAQLAIENGWAGIVVNGNIRDSAVIDAMDVAIMALGTMPKKSDKQGRGTRDASVSFLGVHFTPGDWLYADTDGLLVSPTQL